MRSIHVEQTAGDSIEKIIRLGSRLRSLQGQIRELAHDEAIGGEQVKDLEVAADRIRHAVDTLDFRLGEALRIGLVAMPREDGA